MSEVGVNRAAVRQLVEEHFRAFRPFSVTQFRIRNGSSCPEPIRGLNMITRLKVDGFRSLSRFDMVINPGLNILVGPNGSGKTNIVSFLQFLSYLTTNQLSEAIAKAGGAGAVFQKNWQQAIPKRYACLD
jgi:hypothetical protein